MYAIVDIETTGGYADHHRITEIAIYHHNGTEITDYFYTLINPGRSIPEFITGLTGITTEMVENAPAFEEVADDILRLLHDRVFVAHNAQFDYAFIKKEFEQAGISWSARKLCTVRLSRKIIPGLRSYSLGSLAESLGITIADRHRAGGDAEATAKIFTLLMNQDTEGHIRQALKRNSGETILPPNLPREEFDRLPAKAGVYYFLNEQGRVIYVGKAINIKKRIAGHFTGEAREWSRSRIRQEIHHITYELTGTELIALILESQEIQRLWPRYNQAQKFKTEEWGIFDYIDRQGYQRFSVNVVSKGSHPLKRFSSKTDAWNYLWEKVNEYELCPKLSGLQVAKGPCLHEQSGNCRGACSGKESPKKYNKRVAKALDSMEEPGDTFAIIGKGRDAEERSIILVEKGKYIGHGFFSGDITIDDFEEACTYIRKGTETPVIQSVLNSFLAYPADAEIILFDQVQSG
jgi:DNA polymerase-3 subunit epsilon